MNDIKIDADILWALRTEFPIGSGFKEHAHKNYYHLLYALSGECKLVIDDVEYDMKEGMHMLACPGVMHEMKKITNNSSLIGYEMKFVVFDPHLKRSLKKQDGVVKTDEFSRLLIEALFKTSLFGVGTSSAKARRYFLCALLFNLITPYSEKKEDICNELTIYNHDMENSDISQVSLSTAQYIDANYMNDISLNKIAESMGYNKNYICTVFKRETGMNISDYINHVRVKKAAELLSYSDCELAQICKLTGFADISHFNRTFKKIVGIPPGQYRRSYPADILIEGDDNLSSIKSVEIPVWAGHKLFERNQ